MARDFVSASSQYLEYAGAVLNAVPITMACWAQSTTLTATGVLMSICDASATNRIQLAAAGATAGDPISAFVQGGVSGDAQTSTSYPTNTWFHAAGVFESSTSRSAYLNGGGKGTNTTSSTPTAVNLDVTVMGARYSTTRGLYLNGKIAHAAIWDAALTDAEILVLATGVSPLLVRPANLVAYWPLLGHTDPELEIIGRQEIAVFGPTKSTTEPRIIRPSARIYSFPSAGGGVTGTITVTEANDTLSASGLLGVFGTLSVTEAADTLSAAGQVDISGTLAVTEAADTLSASGAVDISGTLAVTETADTLSASGTITVTGTVGVTEADDTLAASGTVSSGIEGTVAVTEAADTLSASGQVDISGTLAVTEDADTLVASGSIEGTGTLAVTEAADTLSASGTVTVSGSLSVTEADDTSAASGAVGDGNVTGTLAVTEQDDLATISGLVLITGTLAVVEANDTLAANDSVLVESPYIVKLVVVDNRVVRMVVPDTSGARDTVIGVGSSSILIAS